MCGSHSKDSRIATKGKKLRTCKLCKLITIAYTTIWLYMIIILNQIHHFLFPFYFTSRSYFFTSNNHINSWCFSRWGSAQSSQAHGPMSQPTPWAHAHGNLPTILQVFLKLSKVDQCARKAPASPKSQSFSKIFKVSKKSFHYSTLRRKSFDMKFAPINQLSIFNV